jgi:hypothetical protein
MRLKTELISTTKIVNYLLIGLIALLGLLCLYYGSSFAPGSRRSDDAASGFDGSDPVIHYHDLDALLESQDLNSDVPRTIPVRKALFCKFKIFIYYSLF